MSPPGGTRAARALHRIDRQGLGLEIGPSVNPLAPKRDGFNVRTVDHLDRAGLVAKYQGHPGVDVSRIEEVDYVWRGEPYAELTGGRHQFDWIIASHVIEHTPDLIGFLKDCASVLRTGGVLSLVVPDMRDCFDQLRAPSSLASVIDAHLRRAKQPSAGMVAEHFLNASSHGGRIAWHPGMPGADAFIHDVAVADQQMNAVVQYGVYVDVHAWCFVPSSFRLLMHDLAALGFINLHEIDFIATAQGEFHVALAAMDAPPSVDADSAAVRLALAHAARTEWSQRLAPVAAAPPAPAAGGPWSVRADSTMPPSADAASSVHAGPPRWRRWAGRAARALGLRR